jgi:signal peptidase I
VGKKSAGILLWVRDLAVAAVASVLIITFLYQPVRVEGTSMLPRLEDRDRLFINKFVYHFTAIDRGDVVVFHYPRDPKRATSNASSRSLATVSASTTAACS